MNPTIVLVHGAYADSSSWNGVIDRLRDADHPVVAFANPLPAAAPARRSTEAPVGC
jgi:pimeloyl-ACP methyl ester carboxylesterase